MRARVVPCLVVAVLAGPVFTEPARADQVIADDLIVQGQGCLGLDCVNGESFGFDTIRLKETNVRLKFDDTSVAPFPRNDWQLTANSLSSGGDSFFAIDDVTGALTPFKVMAGAPSNALFVEGSTGDVGLGTASPSAELHVLDGNTPTLRLDQDNSQSWGVQTWDVAANEVNFFVRDVTGGSRLPFRIRSGAPTSSVDIRADGSVGMGTSAATQPLHVRRTDGSARLEVEEANGTAETRILADLVNNGPAQLRFSNTAADTTSWLAGAGGGGFVIRTTNGAAADALVVGAGGDATSSGVLQQGADPAAQEAIEAAAPADVLAAIRTLPISRFEYVADGANAKHLAPGGAAFRAALGLGAGDNALAPGDVAAAALAGVQALAVDTSAAVVSGRVDDLSAKVDGLGTIVGALAKQSQTKDRGLSRRVAKLAKANRKLGKKNRALSRRLRAVERKVAALG